MLLSFPTTTTPPTQNQELQYMNSSIPNGSQMPPPIDLPYPCRLKLLFMAATCTNCTAVASAERTAAFVSFQWH